MDSASGLGGGLWQYWGTDGRGETQGAGKGLGAPLAALDVAPARAGGGSLVGPGHGFWVVWGCGALRLCRGVFRHEGSGGGVGDGSGALGPALLLLGSWRQGLGVVEDVVGGWACAAGLAPRSGLGLGLTVGLGWSTAVSLGCSLAVGFG